MRRELFLDTETTGLDPKLGHRIVEIGIVEYIDGKKTGNNFHVYINPQMDVPEEVVKIHGLTNEFLSDKPRFQDISDKFINYIAGSDLFIHNAKFDTSFLDYELMKVNKNKTSSYASKVICTLELDKRLYPEDRKHNLDAICARLGINNEHRTLHGALLDAELLAECYTAISTIHSQEQLDADLEQKYWVRPEILRFNTPLKVTTLTDEEAKSHVAYLDGMAVDTKTTPVFNKAKTTHSP